MLALDPNYAEAWYNLAAIARDQNDIDAARRYLSKAVAADPTYPDPVYNLALLEFDSGAYDEAARLWEKYRELDPDSDWGRKAKQGLQLIGLMANQPGAEDRPEGRRAAVTSGDEFSHDRTGEGVARVLLAHGAGAPMDTPFMNGFAKALAEHGLQTMRFEFAYMASRRTGEGREATAARRAGDGRIYRGDRRAVQPTARSSSAANRWADGWRA